MPLYYWTMFLRITVKTQRHIVNKVENKQELLKDKINISSVNWINFFLIIGQISKNSSINYIQDDKLYTECFI